MKYYITTLPGVEAIAKDEIESKRNDIRVGRILKARNNSLLFFEFHGDHSELLRIGTAEDVYADLCSVELLGKWRILPRFNKPYSGLKLSSLL